MNEIDAEMRKIEDSLSNYLECKSFVDKVSGYMKIKHKTGSNEDSDSEGDGVAEDKGPDFFLTQKEEADSKADEDKSEEFDGHSYEKVIGFDKKRLLELFQEIEDKQM